jgi:hypothetical protein
MVFHDALKHFVQRSLVEDFFTEGYVQALVCTATNAIGHILPWTIFSTILFLLYFIAVSNYGCMLMYVDHCTPMDRLQALTYLALNQVLIRTSEMKHPSLCLIPALLTPRVTFKVVGDTLR